MLHVRHVVLGEVAGIGSGIGDHLVTLIKRLGETEGVLGGKRSFPLEGGEVVKLGGNLFGGFFLLGDDAGFPLTAIGDELGPFLVPNSLGTSVGIGFVLFKVEIDPFAFVFSGGDAKGSVDLGVRGRGEGCNLLFALGEDGEGGSLDTTGGGDIEATVAGAEAGKGTGRVETDEPVGLRAALGGVGEIGHFLAFAEVFPGFLNGSGSHRLHPEAFHGLVNFPVVHDVLKDELTFAAGIASVHDLGDVLLAGE